MSKTKAKQFAFSGKLSDEQISKLDADTKSSALRDGEAIKTKMSPPGALGLPPLLERRRLEFGITDWAFAGQPFNERILVHQVRRPEDTFGGGLIVKTGITKAREERDCPMGVIVAAGAKALDELRSNGIDLGHIVTFMRLVPWRYDTDHCGSAGQQSVMVLQSGDIVSSIDLGDAMRRGDVEMVAEVVDGAVEHQYRDEAGRMWRPATVSPFVPGDM